MVKPFHICLNLRVPDRSWTGGILYILNLVRAIAAVPAAEREPLRLSLSVAHPDLPLVASIRQQVAQIYSETWLTILTAKLAQRLTVATPLPRSLFNPRQVDFVYPDIAGRRSPYPWGGWIPDFQHHHLPHFFSPQEIVRRNANFRCIAEFAPVIVLSSRMVQADLHQLYPTAAARTQVMPFVSYLEPHWLQSDPQAVQHQYGLPDDFFLVCNQFWKHKNHGVVIEALGLLRQSGLCPTVVCTGGLTDYRHPEYYPQLRQRIEQLGLSTQMRILGFIPRSDQIQLMRRCLAVIQPSLFEGWSTVVEDARTLGKPLLLSDFPVHLEQSPPGGYFFERHNATALADLIARLLEQLQPGPDPLQEDLAQQDNKNRLISYGRSFLAIAHSALDSP